MQNYLKLREESLKIAVAKDFFGKYQYSQIGNIDFVISRGTGEKTESLLWAEAKQGKSHNILHSFVQLILTIGKEKTSEKFLPPKYIGAFDAEKFALIEFHSIQDVFSQNDFNWNVTPSNHETKEFRQLLELCGKSLDENKFLFRYETQADKLKEFIKLNFSGKGGKITVTKNNFVFVFQEWSENVKDSIAVDWEKAKKTGIISADFFLADLLSENNFSLKENLYVVLKNTKYELAKSIDDAGLFTVKTVDFKDDQKAHRAFWAVYERPPKQEYWGYIIERRDLLVPQDIRERKGSFFTPQIWVEKSQQYLADVLGENWQDEFYIWDCCAGTGNLLNGLTNYRNVWASTLDKADVDVMQDRILNGWKMFENHVFQFDFLNDDFSKCPGELQEIINDPKKREKLIIYINPPYAEATNARTVSGNGKHREGLSKNSTKQQYEKDLGRAINEIFAQFFVKIIREISDCILAEFSKLKILQAPNFVNFRSNVPCYLEKLFLMPANTFDNVKGDFPIGFHIWRTKIKKEFTEIDADVYDENGNFVEIKKVSSYKNCKYILHWIRQFYDKENEHLAYLRFLGTDFQHNKDIFVTLAPYKTDLEQVKGNWITKNNIIEMLIYFAVRHCISATWLNDRDQFLYPADDWKEDFEFQSDCLIFTLFHGQNRISAEHGLNNWIPFTEEQTGCRKAFKSHFMSDFIAGKIQPTEEKEGEQQSLFEIFKEKERAFEVVFSEESKAVYDAGLELWRYYHAQKNANPDAAFYDIRKYFQGETKGRMNAKSDDETYSRLIADLRGKMKVLADKIAEKVYKYGFLK